VKNHSLTIWFNEMDENLMVNHMVERNGLKKPVWLNEMDEKTND